MYGSFTAPRRRRLDGPRLVCFTAEQDLLLYLLRYPTTTQSEMAQFLREEHGVDVNQSTISRLFKRAKWTRKRARRIAKRIDFSLRKDYLASIADIRAYQMVSLDENLFNETIEWRLTP